MEVVLPKKHLLRSVLLTLPLTLLSIALSIGSGMFGNTLYSISAVMTLIFINYCYFQLFHTGKTDRYRATLFITTALLFPINFIAQNYEARNLFMTLTFEDVLGAQTPFCHIGIVQVLGTLLTKKIIIFPGVTAEIGSTIILWLAYALVLGRGWCSWGCFWGGWDDGFSRLRKKPIIKKIHKNIPYIPFAVLLATVLTSAYTLSTQYCWWICPFKAVSEFLEISTAKIIVQTIIFVSLFLGLVIVLPLLTKKRTQCAFLCPFGAMQSLTNRISPFDVVIDTDRCVQCDRCIETCQFMALNEKSLLTGKSSITCTKCGRCIDVCPSKAIFYHIKGTKIGINTGLKRILFLYPALFLSMFFSGAAIIPSVYRILLFITTGSFIE